MKSKPLTYVALKNSVGKRIIQSNIGEMGLQCMLIQCYTANQCMVIQCYSALQATWQYEGLIIRTPKKFIDLNYFERTCALVQ